VLGRQCAEGGRHELAVDGFVAPASSTGFSETWWVTKTTGSSCEQSNPDDSKRSKESKRGACPGRGDWYPQSIRALALTDLIECADEGLRADRFFAAHVARATGIANCADPSNYADLDTACIEHDRSLFATSAQSSPGARLHSCAPHARGRSRAPRRSDLR
jgi:hypothetical protein